MDYDSLYVFAKDFVVNSAVVKSLERYVKYSSWLLFFVLTLYIFPFFTYFFVYFQAIWLMIFKKRHNIYNIYSCQILTNVKQKISKMWLLYGHIWHGYEVRGFENVLKDRPCIYIFYHGTLPLDMYYIAAYFLLKGVNYAIIGDNFLFKIPGLSLFLDIMNVFPGSIENCTQKLLEGKSLLISPGGLREALFSGKSYDLIWKTRSGFARIAIMADAPIVPVFTQNINEAYRTPDFLKKCGRYLYEKTRLPLLPIYGGFPVKLITHLGQPVFPPSNKSVADFVKLSKQVLVDLIKEHQKMPVSILRAFSERFY